MTVSNQIRDTSPEAESVLIQLIRAQDPSRRLAGAVTASNRVAEQCKNAIRRANPEFSEEEVSLRFIEINYGQEMADNVRQSMTGSQ